MHELYALNPFHLGKDRDDTCASSQLLMGFSLLSCFIYATSQNSQQEAKLCAFIADGARVSS